MKKLCAVAAILILSACSAQGLSKQSGKATQTAYHPIDTVRSELAKMEPPPGGTISRSNKLVFQENSPTNLVWTVVKEDGQHFLRYEATLAVIDDKTTSVRLNTVAGNLEAQSFFNNSPALLASFNVAMEEKIFSTLEKRPFDLSVLHQANVAVFEETATQAAKTSAEMNAMMNASQAGNGAAR